MRDVFDALAELAQQRFEPAAREGELLEGFNDAPKARRRESGRCGLLKSFADEAGLPLWSSSGHRGLKTVPRKNVAPVAE